MIELIGLDGTNGGKVPAIFIKEACEIKKIQSDLALTAAGPYGAINIWMDSRGNLRCEAMRNLCSVEKRIFRSIKDVENWANNWLYLIGVNTQP
jgi:hypothetical protein